MKKIFKISLISIMVIVLFAGCSNKKSEPTAVVSEEKILSSQEFYESLSDYVNISRYNQGIVEEGTRYVYSLNSNLAKEFEFDPLVKLEKGAYISMPMSFGLLRSWGWVPENNIILNPGSTGSEVCKNDGKEMVVFSTNTTSEPLSYVNSTIGRVSFDLYSSEDSFEAELTTAPKFTLCGIDNSTDIKNAILQIGEPSSIEYVVVGEKCAKIVILYQNVSSYDYLKLEFTADGKKLVRVDYNIDIK